MLIGEQLNGIKIKCADCYDKKNLLLIQGGIGQKCVTERKEPDIKKEHRSVVSTHAHPSNSSQMQLETPGEAGVSCPCERGATVELKPKTDTGLCEAK